MTDATDATDAAPVVTGATVPDALHVIADGLGRVLAFLRRHPALAAVLVGGGLLANPKGVVIFTVVLGAVTVVFRTRRDDDDDVRWRAACLYAGLAAEAVMGREGYTTILGHHRQRTVELRPARSGPILEEAVTDGATDSATDGATTRLRVRLVEGLAVADLDRAADRLAVAYRARAVSVAADRTDRAVAHVTIVTGTDALDATDPIAVPDAPSARSAWDPIAVGIDGNGQPVTITLPDRSGVLLGGVPGAGKSTALTVLLRHLALAPDCRLTILDAKGGLEAEPWRPVARVVGDMPGALDTLRHVRGDLDQRIADLRAQGLRKVQPGTPLHVLVIDELAEFLVSAGEKRDRQEFERLLRSIVQTGRAGGVIVIAATQRPSASVVPTSIRDLIDCRVAFRCKTRAASNMILGDDAADTGDDASTIPFEPRGVGIIDTGSGGLRFRCYWPGDDDAVTAIVVAAAAVRGKVVPMDGRTLVEPAAPPAPSVPSVVADPPPETSAPAARRGQPRREQAKEKIAATIADGAVFRSRAAVIAAAGYPRQDGTAKAALADLIRDGVVVVDETGQLRATGQAAPAPKGTPSPAAGLPVPSVPIVSRPGRRVVAVLTDLDPPPDVQPNGRGNGHRT